MPKILEVELVSRAEAEEMEPTKYTGMISIFGSCDGIPELQAGWDPLLRLEITGSDWLEEPGATPPEFGLGHADAILPWLDRHEDSLERIVAQCDHDLRLGEAVACYIADRYGIEGFDRAREGRDGSLNDEEPFRLAELTTLIRVEESWVTPGMSLVDGVETRYQEIHALCTAYGSFGEFRLELYEPVVAEAANSEGVFEQTMQILEKGAVLVVSGQFECSDATEIPSTIYGGKLYLPGRLERLYVTERDAWTREAETR